jgi:hypothetical protein
MFMTDLSKDEERTVSSRRTDLTCAEVIPPKPRAEMRTPVSPELREGWTCASFTHGLDCDKSRIPAIGPVLRLNFARNSSF